MTLPKFLVRAKFPILKKRKLLEITWEGFITVP